MGRGQKPAPRSTWGEERKKNQVAWQKENRVQLAVNVDKKTGDSFRRYCASHGKSVSAVLGEYVREVLRNAETGNELSTLPGKSGEDENERSQDRDSLQDV